MDELVKSRGPLTAYRLAQLLGIKRSKVNAVLHADRHFVKTERSPHSHVNARPVWTWSETKVPLPPPRRHINSRNKTARRDAKQAYEQSLVGK